METMELIRSYLEGELRLVELHRRLHESTWGSPATDVLAADARRIVGEGTSAGWGEDEIREELSRLVSKRAAAERTQDALRDAVWYLDKAYLEVEAGQGSGSSWSIDVVAPSVGEIKVEKAQDQTEAAAQG